MIYTYIYIFQEIWLVRTLREGMSYSLVHKF